MRVLLEGVSDLNEKLLAPRTADDLHTYRNTDGCIFAGSEAGGNSDGGKTAGRAENAVALLLAAADLADELLLMRINHCIELEVSHDLHDVGLDADLVIHLLKITGGAYAKLHSVTHVALGILVEEASVEDLSHAVDGPLGGQGVEIAVKMLLEVVEVNGGLSGKVRLVNIVLDGNEGCAVLFKYLESVVNDFVGGLVDLFLAEEALENADALAAHTVDLQSVHIGCRNLAYAPSGLIVIGVIAGDDIEAANCVLNGTADGACGVLSEGVGNDARTADKTDGGTDAYQGVCRRGGTDGVDGIGADTDDADVGSAGSAGAAGRAARSTVGS